MEIPIMTREEFATYTQNNGGYFLVEQYHSDFFQRFLRGQNVIRESISTIFERYGIQPHTVEIRQEADNHTHVLLIVCNRTKERIINVL